MQQWNTKATGRFHSENDRAEYEFKYWVAGLQTNMVLLLARGGSDKDHRTVKRTTAALFKFINQSAVQT